MTRMAIIFELFTISVLAYVLAIWLMVETVILPGAASEFIDIMIFKMWFTPIVFTAVLCIPALSNSEKPK